MDCRTDRTTTFAPAILLRPTALDVITGAGLLVGHSHAEDVLAMFEDLRHSKALSPALRTGMTDGKILRHYLLLHDSQLKPAGGIPW